MTTNAPVLAGGLAPRTAAIKPRTSRDYVNELLRKRGSLPEGPDLAEGVPTEVKVAKLALVLSDQSDGIRRLGVGMIGPIQIKLRYAGIIRNILVEDPITPGSPVTYDVMDDLGQAYIMSGTDGEVRVTPFEGKRVELFPFRIASFPAIRKEDLKFLRINAVEHAQDETKQAIMKQEDGRLFVILAAAQADYATRSDHTITPNHTVTETSGYFTPESFYTAAALIERHELYSKRVIVETGDWRDFFRWSINQTGWAFKDRVVAGETISTFGEFTFQKSIMQTEGRMFLLPDPDFLGVFPIWQELEVEENHKVENFWKGWVFDEMVSMVILNPRGIASIEK